MPRSTRSTPGAEDCEGAAGSKSCDQTPARSFQMAASPFKAPPSLSQTPRKSALEAVFHVKHRVAG